MSKLFLTTLIFTIFISCSGESVVSKKDLQETLEANPEILINAMKKHPEKYMAALQDMAQKARGKMAERRNAEESNVIDRHIKNPLKPVIRKDELIRGAKKPTITIVEYSDFQCPFCARGADTIKEILKKYPEVGFVFKHLPIDSIHPKARLAAKYYEGVRLVAGEKAFAFHDEILSNQGKIQRGESYLDSVVKSLDVDLKKVRKYVKSSVVDKRINDDVKEASKFGFSGTPGFLVNGIPVKGAYPIEHFEMIIEKITARR